MRKRELLVDDFFFLFPLVEITYSQSDKLQRTCFQGTFMIIGYSVLGFHGGRIHVYYYSGLILLTAQLGINC